jgi:hypothetical protein
MDGWEQMTHVPPVSKQDLVVCVAVPVLSLALTQAAIGRSVWR